MSETEINLRKSTGVNDDINAGYKRNNGIINSLFNVWQRGTSFGPLSSGLTYTADRWFVNRGASNAVVNRVDGPEGSLYAARIQRNSSDTDVSPISFGQAFETNNSHRYAGKKVSLRFKARKGADYSASSDVLNVAIPTGTGSDQSASSGIGGSWTGYINTALDISSVTLTTSWQTFTVKSNAILPSSVSQILAFFQMTPTGTAGAADYFEVADVELVEGEEPNFHVERRDVGSELLACSYYYQRRTSGGVAGRLFGHGSMEGTARGPALIPMNDMRTTPTITSSAATTFRVAQGTVSAQGSSIIDLSWQSAVNAVNLDVQVGSTPFTNGLASRVSSFNTTEAHVTADAEL